MLEEANGGDLFEGVEPSMVAECLDEFKNFYTSRCICLACVMHCGFEEKGIGGEGGRDKKPKASVLWFCGKLSGRRGPERLSISMEAW